MATGSAWLPQAQTSRERRPCRLAASGPTPRADRLAIGSEIRLEYFFVLVDHVVGSHQQRQWDREPSMSGWGHSRRFGIGR
jgi:hypothetical protein